MKFKSDSEQNRALDSNAIDLLSPTSDRSDKRSDPVVLEGELAHELAASKQATNVPSETTISFEEALERELEFRKRRKIATLQASTDSGSLFTPSQVLPPKPSLTGIKRKAVSENLLEQEPYGSQDQRPPKQLQALQARKQRLQNNRPSMQQLQHQNPPQCLNDDIMPRRKRFHDVNVQTSQDVSFSDQSQQSMQPQQSEISPSFAHQPEVSPSLSTQHTESQHDPHADEEVIMDEIHIQDGSGRVRIRRGPTRARDIWQLAKDERVVIQCNQMGQPVNKATRLLTSFLGTVARKGPLCPLNYVKWNDMLPAYKVELLRVVQSKFVLSLDSHDWVLKSLNRKWKEFKAMLKRDYKREGMIEDDVARICPPNVDRHQWRELVCYWFSERGQAYSDIGKAARAALSVAHTSGSKSYARRRQEFMDKHGREPGQVEFYKLTHIHRDGSFVSAESRDIFEKASSIIAKRVSESSASVKASCVEAQVMTELLGPDRYGRVRGYGVGVTPTQLFEVSRYTQDARESSSNTDIRRMETQMEARMKVRMEAEMEAMKHKYDTVIYSMRSQIEQLTSVTQTFVDSSRVPDSSSCHRVDDDYAPTDH